MKAQVEGPVPPDVIPAALATHLREGTTAERVAAAEALRDYGPAAVDVLCEALAQWNPMVRAVAAESLGLIGDERAIGPLTEALRRCFVGKSARIQLYVGALAGGGGLGLLAVLLKPTALPLWQNVVFYVLLLPVTGVAGALHLEYSRRRNHYVGSLVAMLDLLAERTASPAMLGTVPLLRAVAVDVFHQNGETMAAAKQLADRIERHSAAMKDLPISASPSVGGLPYPADAPAPTGGAFPVVRG